RSNASHFSGELEQADATAWMAMFCLNMLRISLDHCEYKKVYQHMATKFLEQFLNIDGAMNNIANENNSLWNEEDGFFFDVLHLKGKDPKVMKVKSVVGIIPMFAVEPIPERLFENLPDFKRRMDFFLKEKPKLAALVSSYIQPGHGDRKSV